MQSRNHTNRSPISSQLRVNNENSGDYSPNQLVLLELEEIRRIESKLDVEKARAEEIQQNLMKQETEIEQRKNALL